jgi:2-keto-4-pentenoate hydratase/2-oxohepta-3-ene-1,7-dioic acid hydratase in catechol pathway
MRLASADVAGEQRWGAVVDEQLVPLDHAWPSLRDALPSGHASIAAAAGSARERIPLGDVRLLPPIPDPEKIFCAGINYRAHVQETGRAAPAYPSIFMRFPDSQVGDGAAIVRPFLSESFDFESELAVVIGRRGRHIAQSEALSYVGGYACFGDHSIRDYQQHQTQATPGKNFDRSGGFGPWLVTTEDIPDPTVLTLTGRLNGTVVQQTQIGDLLFDIPYLIAYLSSFAVLKPGDVIATGTPAGVGFTRRPPLWMRAGDVFEVEISRIGILRNHVIDEERPL